MTTRFQCANVVGIAVGAVNMDSALEIIHGALQNSTKSYVCLVGAHGIVAAQRDPAFAKCLGEALIALPDGMPTVWIGRHQGFRTMDRVFGPDLMLAVFERLQNSSCTHFFYGGRPGVAEELRIRLHAGYPQARIVGTYTPPFRALSLEEEQHLIAEIARLQPDIVWVGISTPKQERFMADFLPRLQTRMMIGVGAAFDYHTGRISDSPKWLKRAGMQWAHRLIQDPKRLWRRYLHTNTSFLLLAMLQWFGLKRFRLDAPATTHAE